MGKNKLTSNASFYKQVQSADASSWTDIAKGAMKYGIESAKSAHQHYPRCTAAAYLGVMYITGGALIPTARVIDTACATNNMTVLQVLSDSVMPLPSVKAQLAYAIYKGILLGSLNAGVAASVEWAIFELSGRTEEAELVLTLVDILGTISLVKYTDNNLADKIHIPPINNSEAITSVCYQLEAISHIVSFSLTLYMANQYRLEDVEGHIPDLEPMPNHHI